MMDASVRGILYVFENDSGERNGSFGLMVDRVVPSQNHFLCCKYSTQNGENEMNSLTDRSYSNNEGSRVAHRQGASDEK